MVANELFLLNFESGFPTREHKKDELLNDQGATLAQKGAEGKTQTLKFLFTHMLTNVINTHCER